MKSPNASSGRIARLFGTVLLAWAGVGVAFGEVPTVTIKATVATISEAGSNNGVFAIARTGSSDADLTVYYNVSGTASNGVDVAPLPGSVTIPAGSSNATVLVQPIDDAIPEATEYVVLSLKSDPAYSIGSPASASVAVLDNDNLAPWITIVSPANGAVLTGPTNIMIQAQAADPDGSIRNVNFYVNGTYLGGNGTSGNGNQTSNPPPIGATGTYALSWSNVVSGHFVLTASVYDNLGATNTSAPVSITVNLDPAVSIVKVAATDAYASEPGTDTGTFTISRSGNTNQELTVHYAVTGTATAGADYQALSGSAVIPANALSVTVPVLPLDDLLVEPTETVILTLVSDPSYFLGDGRTATVYILDNDTNTPPTVALTAPAGGSSFKDPSGISLTADAADSDGIVTRVDFYVNGSLLATDTNSPFAATWSSMQAGTYVLTAKATDNMGAATTSQPVSVTVGRTPMVRFNVTDAYASEPGTDTATIQVYRFNNTNDALTVSYTVGGTATPGADYVALLGSVTIPAGVSTVPVVIQPIDDLLLEPTETVVLTLSSNAAYAITDPRTATAYILDNETNVPPSVMLTAPADGATFVDPTNIVLTAAVSDVAGSIIRVDYLANGILVGSATNSPYAATWANMMDGGYVLTAKATDNLGAVATSQPVSITVRRRSVVHVYATDAYASEPGGTDCATVQVYRYYNTNTDLVVNYTVGGTAVSGVDYVALLGSVTIPAGLTSVPIVIQPLDNTMPKPTGTVVVTVTNAQAYIVGDPRSATVYIRNTVTNNPPSVALTAPADGAVFVDPTNILLTAEASDADGAVARVDFLANGLVVGSATNRPYAVRWQSMAPGVYALTAKATDNVGAIAASQPVTITVARTSQIRVFALDAYASVAGDCATVQVYRYYNTNVDLVVNYVVSGTASNGVDYVALPGSVTIPAGRAFVNLTVQPLSNPLPGPTETVIVTLSNNTAYTALDPRSAVVYILNYNTNRPPVVSLTAPAQGMAFNAPTTVVVTAAASDPDGAVVRVDFFANNASIGSAYGVSTGDSKSPVGGNLGSPGVGATNNPWTVRWCPTADGAYTLTAKAVDNIGACATSLPVNITVARLPVVQIYATDAHASKQGTDTGLFTLYRSANTNQALDVSYAIGGTATNGVDYALLSGVVTVPAGALSATIPVVPLAGGAVQKSTVQTVTLSLLPTAAYQVGSPTQATVSIYSEPPPNVPPVVRLTAPTNGATLDVSVRTVLQAEASDADGAVVRVDFLVNGSVIGSASNAPYAAPWSIPAAGYYVLTARATDDRGAAVVSASVRVIAAVIPKPTATRYLPLGYVPGVRLLVMIGVSQPTAFGSFTVADRPPDGWTVAGVGVGGRYDALEDMVRFGPMTLSSGQIFTYEVIPPAGTTGVVTFAGALTTDGVSVPVGGAASLAPIPPHPADCNPADFVMTLSEAAAYCDAWKNATASPQSANTSLSVSYAARAGYLSQGSGIYTVSTNYPTPVVPMVWVTNAAAASTPLYATTGYGTAVSVMPSNYVPGQAYTVTIAVTPAAGNGAFALEEHPPVGWAVTNVSDQGAFSAPGACVRWGLFLDGQPATVSYDVTPATNSAAYGAFSGVVSFDGVNIPISGVRKTSRSP